MGRYLVVCFPLQARHYASIRANVAVVLGAFLFSVVVQLPRIWHYELDPQPCIFRVPEVPPPPVPAPAAAAAGQSCPCFFYYRRATAIYRRMEFSYGVVCCLVDTFLPLVVLVFCNVCLIRARNRSRRLRAYRRDLAPGQMQVAVR